jgi:alpha-galactosidase
MMTQAEFTLGGDYYYARHVTNADYVHFKAGADRRALCRPVLPGESAVSPKIHIGQIYGDLDVCVNEFNEHLRLSVIPKRSQPLRYPIAYNHSAYTNNCQIGKRRLMAEVDIAARVGAEMFIVDAGWFGSADKVWASVRGDWHENELLEEGLGEVFEKKKKNGMMCGLWMEAEGMDFGSRLAEEHPDWFICAYGKKLPTINLLRPDAEKFVFDSICGIIDRYRLDLFRIDGGLKEPSEEPNGASGIIEGTSWQYFEKLYAIFEKVRQKYPHVYFENCSGGGGRSDLGMMRRFDWMQATDNFAPVAQLRTIYGMTLALAPEQLLSITGAFMKHQTDEDFLARSAIFGRPEVSGIADKIEHINPCCLDAWKRALALYKEELRPMLGVCRIFHHTPLERYMEKGKWLALELASPSCEKSFAGVFRLEGEETGEYRLYPKGISADGIYRAYSDNSQKSVEVPGLSLIRDGYPVRLPGKLTSDIIVFTLK